MGVTFTRGNEDGEAPSLKEAMMDAAMKHAHLAMCRLTEERKRLLSSLFLLSVSSHNPKE